MQGNGSKFKSLKSCLHGDNLFTPLIILMTHFCNLKIVLLFESPPQKINPYFKLVWPVDSDHGVSGVMKVCKIHTPYNQWAHCILKGFYNITSLTKF
jgi:hypothetical protein